MRFLTNSQFPTPNSYTSLLNFVGMRILLYIFFAYIIYQVIFKFIIPVYVTTKHVKKGFRDMKEKMNEHANKQETSQKTNPEDSASKEKVGEYIDFEEIK